MVTKKLSNRIVSLRTKAAGALTALALVLAFAQSASATRCIVDVDGANDDPGQKDVTQFCTGLGSGNPYDVHATASLDLAGLSGSNTADLCFLFDADLDGNVNLAVCTTVAGDPAALTDLRLLACNDSRSDKCAGAVKINACSNNGASCLGDAVCGEGGTCSGSFRTICRAAQMPSDPFPSGDSHPLDTVLACAIDLDDFGAAGANARLINMGAYSSASLSSDMSDAVLPPLCSSDADCAGGKVCHLASGECYLPEVSGCTADSQCESDERCEVATGICVPGGCSSDSDCPAGKECNLSTGLCETPIVSGCTEDADCATGLLCDVVTGDCIDTGAECTMDSDCPVGQVCNALSGLCQDASAGGSCTSDADCIPTQECNVLAGVCVDVDAPCTSDADCGSGETCNVSSGVCEIAQLPCSNDADCVSLDNECGIGFCNLAVGKCSVAPQNEGNACGEPGTCSEGGICSGGACVAVTACDPDCSICDGGHCLSLCGNPHDSIGTSVTVTDALFILRTAVKLEECGLCVCDVNSSGSVTAVDTLKVLRLMVRLPETLACPAYR